MFTVQIVILSIISIIGGFPQLLCSVNWNCEALFGGKPGFVRALPLLVLGIGDLEKMNTKKRRSKRDYYILLE